MFTQIFVIFFYALTSEYIYLIKFIFENLQIIRNWTFIINATLIKLIFITINNLQKKYNGGLFNYSSCECFLISGNFKNLFTIISYT